MPIFNGVISRMFVELAVDSKKLKAGLVGARKTADDTATRMAASAQKIERSYAGATRTIGAFQSAIALAGLAGAAGAGVGIAERQLRLGGEVGARGISIAQSNAEFQAQIQRSQLSGLTPLQRLERERALRRADQLRSSAAASISGTQSRATVNEQFFNALLESAGERSRGGSFLRAPVSAAVFRLGRTLLSRPEREALAGGELAGLSNNLAESAFSSQTAQRVRPGGLIDQQIDAERRAIAAAADPSLGPRSNAEVLQELQRIRQSIEDGNSQRFDTTAGASQ